MRDGWIAEDHAFATRMRTAVDDEGDDSDWADVRRRARVLEPRRRHLSRARIAVIAVVLAALAVTPALGLDDRVRNLFAGESAPAEIERLFASVDADAPAGMATGVIAEDVHKLIEISTSDGRSAILWVAPTRGGGVCAYIQRVGQKIAGGPGCSGATAGTDLRPGIQGPPGDDPDGPVFLHGRVLTTVTTLDLRFADGDAAEVPVVEGFYLFEVPPSRYEATRQPAFVIGRDQDGDEVGRGEVLGGFGAYPGADLP